MKNYFLAAILTMTASLSYAQTARLSGRICDSDRIPVDYATVAVLAPDSTFVTGTASAGDGAFAFELSKGQYIVKISALSFKEEYRNVDFTQTTDIGTVTLAPKQQCLARSWSKGSGPR